MLITNSLLFAVVNVAVGAFVPDPEVYAEIVSTALTPRYATITPTEAVLAKETDGAACDATANL